MTEPEVAFDLDAARAARLELEPYKLVRQAGRDWRFKTEIPLSIGELVVDGRADVVELLGTLLLDPGEADDFCRSGLSLTDLNLIVEKVYGLRLGELQASRSYSGRNGRSARQTFSGSTR